MGSREAERLNDPDSDTAARNKRERDLLSTLADGFAQIAAALALLQEDPNQPVLLGRAADVARAVGEKFRLWWEHNGEATINLGAKVSMLGAGTALLGLLDVDVNLGASLAGGLVGGKDVVAALKRKLKK